jgi:hypothetical protein
MGPVVSLPQHITLSTLGRDEDAVDTCDLVIRRFGEATELGLQKAVATALLNRGLNLGSLGRGADGLTAYQDLIRRFGDNPDPSLQAVVAAAVANEAEGPLGELSVGRRLGPA